MRKFRVVGLIVTLLSLMTWTSAYSFAEGDGPTSLHRHPSGLWISDGPLPTLPDACVAAASPVAFLIDAYRAEYGIPLIDPDSCRVTLPASPHGLDLLSLASQGQLMPPLAPEVEASGKRVFLPRVDQSLIDVVGLTISAHEAWSAAERVSQGIIDTAATPTAFQVRMDLLQGAAVVVAGPEVLDLLDLIAPETEGVDVIIEVRSDLAPASLDSRPADWGPHKGGSRINAPVGGCTAGFMWDTGRPDAVVTAGHCAHAGGWGAWPSPYAHQIEFYANSRENWNPGTGTVVLTGQTQLLGDLAMGYQRTGPYGPPPSRQVYVGGSSSNTYVTVAGYWTTPATQNHQYCVGGATTGELCGWKVVSLGYENISYYNNQGVYVGTARRIVHGTKSSPCTMTGDSGGPVYTKDSNGKAWAKGYHSGGSGGSTCHQYFTDQPLADQAFPGSVIVG